MKKPAIVLATVLIGVSLFATSYAVNPKTIYNKDEYAAYMAAANETDPALKASKLEDFIQAYPASVVKMDALEQAMASYQIMGNQEKTESAASRILEINPDHVQALSVMTFFRREKAAAGDAAALADLRTGAERGLQALPVWPMPEGLGEEAYEKLKTNMSATFNGAAGFAAYKAKDYDTARGYYLKAIEANPTGLQDVYELALNDLQRDPLDPLGFWYIGRAMHLAAGSPETLSGIAQYGQAMYVRYHGSEDGWDTIVASAGAQDAPPDGFSVSVSSGAAGGSISSDAGNSGTPAPSPEGSH